MATTKFYFTIDKRGKRMLLFSTILDTIVYASTPSDKGHGGKNNANITMKKAF